VLVIPLVLIIYIHNAWIDLLTVGFE